MKEIEVRHKIKEYCHSRKISLRELSRLSGVSEETLYHKKNYSLQIIGKLITALDCKFEDLFEILELE